MKTLGLVVLMAGMAFGQSKTEFQCDMDKAKWTDELRADFDSLHRMSYDAMFIRSAELETCQLTIVHQPSLIENGKVGVTLYDVEMENWSGYLNLRMVYAEESARRLGVFVNEHHLGDSFHDFDKMLVRLESSKCPSGNACQTR
jgi:hypothetical protein